MALVKEIWIKAMLALVGHVWNISLISNVIIKKYGFEMLDLDPSV